MDITAFVGRALRGPTDQPVTVSSFAEYERTFGGLWQESSLGFAVRDFFLNGGRVAVVVRLYRSAGAGREKAVIRTGDLQLQAASPGAWGNALRIRWESAEDVEAEQAALQLGVPPADLFTLRVRDGGTGLAETLGNVTLAPSARYLGDVLARESALARLADRLPGAAPTPHDTPDGAMAPDDVWASNAFSSGVQPGDEASDGDVLDLAAFVGTGKQAAHAGLYALDHADLINLLCIPPYRPRLTGQRTNGDVDAEVVSAAAAYCEQRRAFLLVDSPGSWRTAADVRVGLDAVGTTSRNAALFFPRLRQAGEAAVTAEDTAPCGAVAGVMARLDAQHGVWKAAAGVKATLVGAPELSVSVTERDHHELNRLGVNCIRRLPSAGTVIWGARTLQGRDVPGSEWRYVPVRRTALHIEQSLVQGLQWAVFEPNDQSLWSNIQQSVGAFLQGMFRQSAFAGRTAQEAYWVKCDGETTTQADVELGRVNVVVGFAPMRPAEFVVIRITQLAGQTSG